MRSGQLKTVAYSLEEENFFVTVSMNDSFETGQSCNWGSLKSNYTPFRIRNKISLLHYPWVTVLGLNKVAFVLVLKTIVYFLDQEKNIVVTVSIVL